MTPEDESLGDRWYVTNGVLAAGPLDFNRLAESVAYGRIPASSFVRHASWRVWRRFGEVQSLSPNERWETVNRLAGLSAGAAIRAADPSSEPPPPLEHRQRIDSAPESHPPTSTMRPAAVNPVGVLARAETLDDALMLSLSTAVAASHADVGLLHCDRTELGVVATAYAQGQNAEHLLGDRLPDDDPSLLAGRAGLTVVGEPHLGEAGRHIAGRLSRSLGTVRGVAMVPVLVFGRMVAMLEVGREQRPFCAREVARIEDVVEALTARIVVSGWLE